MISILLCMLDASLQMAVTSMERPGLIMSAFGLLVGFGAGNVAVLLLTLTTRLAGS